MNEQEFFAQILHSHYGKSIRAFHKVQGVADASGHEIYQLVRLELEDASSWMLQAYHDSYPSRRIFPWTGFPSVTSWLSQRAAVLTFLAEQNYPAPRLALTNRGEPICQSPPWQILLSSSIDGQTEEYTPHTLELIGQALGWLHSLPLPPEVGPSWWTPTTLSYGIATLCAVKDAIPPQHQELLAAFLATFRTIQVAPLSLSVIHGDCWPLNALRNGNQLVLIDWEFAGRGAALLDLAGFLLMGHCDRNGDLSEAANAVRIAAILRGYTRFCLFSEEEVSRLGEALRFVIAWRGAMIFERVKTAGWHQELERPLARAARGYRAAANIAPLALQALTAAAPDTRH